MSSAVLVHPFDCHEYPTRARTTWDDQLSAPPRLLVLHYGKSRLIALVSALADSGYAVTGAGDAAETRTRIGGTNLAHVLITEPGHERPPPGVIFARECLAAAPALRVIYLTSFPWPHDVPLLERERLLRSPFTEPAFAAVLARR